MTTLVEEMHLLLDNNEDVKEAILLGKLPSDIAEIAAKAMDGNQGSQPLHFKTPESYRMVSGLIQSKFFPNAPDLERGGFMKAMMGSGPAPAWLIIMQVAGQMVSVAKDEGYEIEITED